VLDWLEKLSGCVFGALEGGDIVDERETEKEIDTTDLGGVVIPTVMRSGVVGYRRAITIIFTFAIIYYLSTTRLSVSTVHNSHFRSGVPRTAARHTPFPSPSSLFFDARTLRRTGARRPCRWINRLLFFLIIIHQFTIRLVTVCSNLTVGKVTIIKKKKVYYH